MSATDGARDARVVRLWAELEGLYADAGVADHFACLRRVDEGFWAQRDRERRWEVTYAAQAEQNREDRRRWEAVHPEEVARRQKIAEESAIRQRELDLVAAEGWASELSFSRADRARLVEAVRAGADVIATAVRIRDSRDSVVERIEALEGRVAAVQAVG